MFFPFLVIGVIGSAIAALTSRKKQANQSWAAAARTLGITLKPTGGLGGLFGRYSMTGTVRSLQVTIDTHSSNDRTYTRYRVRYPSLNLGLTAKRQHPIARIGKFFGMQDIEIGDPVFDEAIILKGDYPENVIQFLTPDRRVAITGLIENFPNAVITDTEIVYSQPKFVTLASDLTSIMQRIISVAQALQGVDPISRRAVERRLAGDVTEALDMLEQAGSSGDPFIDFARKQQVGEIRYARGDNAGARQIFEQLKDQAPKDPGLERWAKQAASQHTDRPSGGDVETADAPTVAEHLFHKDNYSFDTMEIFENEYEGRTVSWTGDLKRLRRFDHDRDFGDGPAVKAVLRIAVLGTDIYSGRDVDAVVRLPESTADTLEIGGRYSFQGTLSRCDPAMRNLFVTEAALI